MTGLADNPLVRAIGRVPITVQRKLLVAFAFIVGLLVILGVLGLRDLSATNDRVVALGQLQQRVAAYGELQRDTRQLDQLLTQRDDFISPPDLSGGPDRAGVAATDATMQAILTRLGPYASVTGVGFAPPPQETSILTAIHAKFGQFYAAISSSFAADQAGTYRDYTQGEADEVLALRSDADKLVSITQAATATLIAQNQSSYLDSQHLFVAVAAGSILLALVLGFVLSGALIGPIKQVRTRLAAITSGDFSGHVDVSNRDELGALAADLNRMNDQLGRLYKELENASRHKSEFLASMSHELRTPLNAIIGFSEVLQDRLFGDINDKQAEYLGDIHSSGRHLLALINDILDLSKIEAGRMELQISSFTLSEVLENSVALMRERATRGGITLRSDVDPAIGVVEADERKLKQVLFNLLSNAVKFTPRGGHVDVTARNNGGEVMIAVRDDGIGIALADQARIFDEFVQAGDVGAQEGTGLGLALSKRFIELHGGSLTVESTPGHGSTFTFRMPRRQSSDGAVQPEGSPHLNIATVSRPTSPIPS